MTNRRTTLKLLIGAPIAAAIGQNPIEAMAAGESILYTDSTYTGAFMNGSKEFPYTHPKFWPTPYEFSDTYDTFAFANGSDFNLDSYLRSTNRSKNLLIKNYDNGNHNPNKPRVCIDGFRTGLVR